VLTSTDATSCPLLAHTYRDKSGAVMLLLLLLVVVTGMRVLQASPVGELLPSAGAACQLRRMLVCCGDGRCLLLLVAAGKAPHQGSRMRPWDEAASRQRLVAASL
jgi:hypothetical protein